jgi:hypothetical protein
MPRNIKPKEEGQVAKQQEEAVRVWEQAIAAKGGRERLHTVSNMVISTRGNYSSRLLKKGRVRREEVLVLPNKYWFLDDYRPDVFGLTISMYNYDTNMKYVISEGDPHHRLESIPESRRNRALRNNQLSFLLETKWLEPTPIKATTGRIGLRSVDIVQTTVNGERVDFAFERKTHLPIRVSYYNIVKGQTSVNVFNFSDYIEVSGIKVPQRFEYDDGSEYKATFQFNVEYNEDIFVKPPSISAGSAAWKKKED